MPCADSSVFSEEEKSKIQEALGEDEFYKNFDKFVQSNYDVP
jgi:hypothetical protein